MVRQTLDDFTYAASVSSVDIQSFLAGLISVGLFFVFFWEGADHYTSLLLLFAYPRAAV